jgi:hypothetical protein
MRMQAFGADRRRRGVSLVLIVVSLVSLMGVLAISLDGGMLLTERREAQATADAAAMAAAADMYWMYFVDFGADSGGTAKAAAFYTASLNGYANDGVQTKVTVNIPPLSGDYVGKLSYVEVIVEYYHTRGFASIFGTDNVTVRARTVAVGKPSAAPVGILVLDPLSKSAFNAGGGGSVTVQNTPIIVDSTSQQGSIANGGTTVTAPEYDLVGNYTTSGGGTFYGPFNLGINNVSDPLASLPVPNTSMMTVQQHKQTQLTSGTTVLYPGIYKGGISASSTANVILMPGIYYMDAGGFNFTGSGSLVGNGVMIYNYPGNGNSNGISISANASVTLSAPTSGIYAGVLFFQDRTSSVAATISGGANSSLTGTFYFPAALLTVSGSGAFTNGGSQYISYDLNIQGTGSVNIDWEPDKVARVRLITIVE